MSCVESNVYKTINCREAGFECDYIVKGQTEEEVMKNGAGYAIRDTV